MILPVLFLIIITVTTIIFLIYLFLVFVLFLQYIVKDSITVGLERSLSTGNWDVKRFRMHRKGMTQVLPLSCLFSFHLHILFPFNGISRYSKHKMELDFCCNRLWPDFPILGH